MFLILFFVLGYLFGESDVVFYIVFLKYVFRGVIGIWRSLLNFN